MLIQGWEGRYKKRRKKNQKEVGKTLMGLEADDNTGRYEVENSSLISNEIEI